jgi:hypothetical protein
MWWGVVCWIVTNISDLSAASVFRVDNLFYPEDGSSRFLSNVPIYQCILPHIPEYRNLNREFDTMFYVTSVDTSFPSSWRLLSASDWSTKSDSYMGIVNSTSVDIRRSTLGAQMWSVIHVWDRSHSSHIQACCEIQIHKHLTQTWRCCVRGRRLKCDIRLGWWPLTN